MPRPRRLFGDPEALGLLGTLLAGLAHLLDAAGNATDALAELVGPLGGLVHLAGDPHGVRLDRAVARHQVTHAQAASASHRDAEHLARPVRPRDEHCARRAGDGGAAREKSALATLPEP